MTTHVFIVDKITFKYHLEYLFAGTGAKENQIDFNNSSNTSIHPTTENMLVSMMADVSRIRENDLIIFYLQQDFSSKIFEGKFFGIFKVAENQPFLDNNDQNQYLRNELGKSLTFRITIEPYQVYPKGVTEWEALDEIRNIQSPNQMLWSLIYRKLKGNRGCTMITIYESDRLCQLLRNKNLRNELNVNSHKLTFNGDAQEIELLEENQNVYLGRRENISILARLQSKYNDNKSFESHLQLYIASLIGKGIHPNLDSVLVGDGEIEWIGNEVSCGVGMQRIDLAFSKVFNSQRIFIPIELKAVCAIEDNIQQLQRYVDWIEQYYLPNRTSDVQPVILARAYLDSDRVSNRYQKLIDAIRDFNTRNGDICDVKYIELTVNNNDISFLQIRY